MSKEKAARISNARRARAARKSAIEAPTPRTTRIERRDELRKRAREVGIEGRSHMTKGELIDALRNH